MGRFKTFNSTGVAPDGRLYAGDLNAIQDMKADLSDFTQVVDVAQVRVGETGLQLQRYGALEARMTGAMRVDGVLRGLGGLFAGTYTTTQRNAIPAGFRPTGLIIFNSTVGRLEVNTGSDAVPAWNSVGYGIAPPDIPAGQGLLPAGAFVPYGGATAPPGFLFCDGAKYLQSTYPALYAAILTAWNTGGETGSEFRVPDFRGRSPVGFDVTQPEFNQIGKKGGFTTHRLEAGEVPVHSHVVNAHSHTVNAHNHGGVTGAADRSLDHLHTAPSNQFFLTAGVGINMIPFAEGGGVLLGDTVTGAMDRSIDHLHWITAEAPGTNAQAPGTNTQGSGATHNNLQPYGTANFIIKT
jgi:microcystin-dependent protein